MTGRITHEGSVTYPTYLICAQPFSPDDAMVFLAMDSVLMHRGCCHLHPSCHCYGDNEVIKGFYLRLSELGIRKDHPEVKHYKRLAEVSGATPVWTARG